jgi:hypothetical protein
MVFPLDLRRSFKQRGLEFERPSEGVPGTQISVTYI